MSRNILIVLLAGLLVVAEYASPSTAQNSTLPPSTIGPTRTPSEEIVPTVTPTPTVPAYWEQDWLPMVRGLP